MTKHSIAKVCVLTASIFGFSSAAHAADKEVVSAKDKKVVEQTKESCITGDIGVNVVSQYISRGLDLRKSGRHHRSLTPTCTSASTKATGS